MTNPIKPNLKTEIIPIFLIVLLIPLSIYFYFNFPEKIPIHWNFKGEVDGWSGKGFGAFFFPGIILAIYLLMLSLPRIDPKKERYQQFTKTYHLVKNLTVIFLFGLYIIASLNGLEYNIPVNIFVPSGVGFLLIILGNYMGKIKPNWFIGIRTPWTLSNEEVWNKTHRFSGKLFMIAGLIMVWGAFVTNHYFGQIFISTIIVLMATPIIYSYLLYQKEKK